MAIEIIKCPTCRQKLAVQPSMLDGALVVCANARCGTSLRIAGRRPLRVEPVPERETYQVDYRPESFG